VYRQGFPRVGFNLWSPAEHPLVADNAWPERIFTRGFRAMGEITFHMDNPPVMEWAAADFRT
jgi:hypothetical protein